MCREIDLTCVGESTTVQANRPVGETTGFHPELQEVMEDLLESVYGEEYLSQQSQLSVAAQVSDEGDDTDKFNEASSCDPDPTSLAREFVESSSCEENEQDGSGEGVQNVVSCYSNKSNN